jgi:nucleotide-binding universal stress UspA family protein
MARHRADERVDLTGGDLVRRSARAAQAQQAALAGLPADLAASAAIVDGASWEDALDAVRWEDGEILVIGSGRIGLGRIFLGSNASRIIRNAPVPTMVAPGGPQP